MFSEIVLSCFIIATMSAGIAQAQQVGSAQDGLQFAREACAECHLVDKTVGESPNTDAPTFEAIAKNSRPNEHGAGCRAADLASRHAKHCREKRGCPKYHRLYSEPERS